MRLSLPSPDPILSQFQIGPLTIHTYALCILTGIVVAVIIAQRRLVARGGQRGQVIDIILWAVPLGIVGARFYHVFTHGGDRGFDSMLRAFNRCRRVITYSASTPSLRVAP